ncbi:hypothetical protein [Aeromonas veronii]|uniref:hypothetical protein n=1 Tax=Aeromonas veronii TaxID=654 RepID=UPI003D190D4A
MGSTKKIQITLEVPADFEADALVVHFTPPGERGYHLELSGKGRVYGILAQPVTPQGLEGVFEA